MTSAASSAVPKYFAERFAKAFAEFVDAVRAAVADTIATPALANTPAFLVWQTQALPRLEQENESIQKAMANFLAGETGAIVRLAANKRALARSLDGFPLTFAGPDRAPTLDRLETAVVVAAYQICSVAGLP